MTLRAITIISLIISASDQLSVDFSGGLLVLANSARTASLADVTCIWVSCTGGGLKIKGERKYFGNEQFDDRPFLFNSG